MWRKGFGEPPGHSGPQVNLMEWVVSGLQIHSLLWRRLTGITLPSKCLQSLCESNCFTSVLSLCPHRKRDPTYWLFNTSAPEEGPSPPGSPSPQCGIPVLLYVGLHRASSPSQSQSASVRRPPVYRVRRWVGASFTEQRRQESVGMVEMLLGYSRQLQSDSHWPQDTGMTGKWVHNWSQVGYLFLKDRSLLEFPFQETTPNPNLWKPGVSGFSFWVYMKRVAEEHGRKKERERERHRDREILRG